MNIILVDRSDGVDELVEKYYVDLSKSEDVFEKIKIELVGLMEKYNISEDQIKMKSVNAFIYRFFNRFCFGEDDIYENNIYGHEKINFIYLSYKEEELLKEPIQSVMILNDFGKSIKSGDIIDIYKKGYNWANKTYFKKQGNENMLSHDPYNGEIQGIDIKHKKKYNTKDFEKLEDIVDKVLKLIPYNKYEPKGEMIKIGTSIEEKVEYFWRSSAKDNINIDFTCIYFNHPTPMDIGFRNVTTMGVRKFGYASEFKRKINMAGKFIFKNWKNIKLVSVPKGYEDYLWDCKIQAFYKLKTTS